MDGLNELIKQNHIGSARQLAILLNISAMAISKWKKRGQVPAERVAELVAASNPRIAKYKFREDLYPKTKAA